MHILPSHDIVGPPRFLALFGDGEHAQVVAETAIAAGWTIAGIINDTAPDAGIALHHLGNERDLPAICSGYPDLQFIIAVSNRESCHAIAARLRHLPWATVVHPTAWISPSARLGAGTVVGPLSVVNTHAILGQHTIIGAATVVDHHAQIGDFTVLGSRVVVGNNTSIGPSVDIAAGACLRDFLTIGEHAHIGAGSAITESLAPEAQVGAPAVTVGDASRQPAI